MTTARRKSAGPELTGMGGHHPAAYFAESILNPNAVLVEGPDYIGEDGYSKMPAYDGMTLRELADVVAFLRSLQGDESQHDFTTELNRIAAPALLLWGDADAFALRADQQRIRDAVKRSTWVTYDGAGHALH